MGILLVYDVTDERSFGSEYDGNEKKANEREKRSQAWYKKKDVRNWFSNIEQHASEGVNKILIGNKCDMEEKRVRVFYSIHLGIRRYGLTELYRLLRLFLRSKAKH